MYAAVGIMRVGGSVMSLGFLEGSETRLRHISLLGGGVPDRDLAISIPTAKYSREEPVHDNYNSSNYSDPGGDYSDPPEVVRVLQSRSFRSLLRGAVQDVL